MNHILKFVIKVLEFDAESHMVFFLCIDYTIWPGWNHRGVYVLSRTPELKELTLPSRLFVRKGGKGTKIENLDSQIVECNHV